MGEHSGPDTRRTAVARAYRIVAAVVTMLALAWPAIRTPSAAADTPAAPWPNVRPLMDRTFERTPARLARGEYLVEGLLQCVVCHSERDATRPGMPPLRGREAAGVVWSDDGRRRLVAPNLTPDPETGIGRWSDDMLARAIREGVSHDGRPLHPQMWYGSFRGLHDEDLASVIVYLRSLTPVRNPLPRTELPAAELQRIAAGLRPLTAPVPPPPLRTPAERGAYLLGAADCAGCHTSWHTPRMPGLFGGGNRITRGAMGAFSANLTPHATGLLYGPETFVEVMRTGRWGTLSPTMPWVAFRRLTDADLHDIHAALATASPVAHAVTNETPSHCEVCGGEHGGGERNRIAVAAAASLPAETLRRYVGRYRFAEYDDTVDVVLEDGGLWFANAGARHPLVPRDERRFDVPGWATPVEFVVEDGRVPAFVTVGPWSDRYERVATP